MRAVVQRVNYAKVEVEGSMVGSIEKGLLVFLGVGNKDTEADILYLIKKITGLRVFEDEQGKMNKSVTDIGGSILVVSQFTLYGDVKKGMRPSFTEAAEPSVANRYYELFAQKIKELGIPVQKGVFGADMKVSLLNDGPVTLLLDSSKLF
ncbi:MAG: D-aminoacyl-tRNA deacylase [Bacillota bacterium]|nr:D-aminoacyl-tRNA deacylase [Bacillota bacterium]